MFGKRVLFVMKWNPNFNPNTQVVTYVPMWVRLPGLPCQFWHDEVLAGIGNWIENLIIIDKATRAKSLMIFARLCVSISPSSNLLDSINLVSELEVWSQPIEYEKPPHICNHCKQKGHISS